MLERSKTMIFQLYNHTKVKLLNHITQLLHELIDFFAIHVPNSNYRSANSNTHNTGIIFVQLSSIASRYLNGYFRSS